MSFSLISPIVLFINGRYRNFVYYVWKNKQFKRKYVKPCNPDTAYQRNNRNRFADAVKSWQALTEAEKSIYTQKAVKLNMSGYNLFISMFINKGIALQKKPYKGKLFELRPEIKNHTHSVSGSEMIREWFYSAGHLTQNGISPPLIQHRCLIYSASASKKSRNRPELTAA
jgi:hypothetical protein